MNLVGENLGERHRDLNSKVTEAVVKKKNFEEIKSQPDNCDVDKLFKIDLASKYKNIDYILEVLKCGDIFYITRALKCLWLYTDDYSQYINTDYLDTNIFPSMSMKMKRKMILTISIHIRCADRAIDFYKYCINDKLNRHALKFLVFTPNNFKLDLLKSNNFNSYVNVKYLKQFIGNSFELALAYLALHDYSNYIIIELCFLFNVSQEDYLNILENYIRIETICPGSSQRLAIRISRDILNIHKQRVLDKPLLYVNILNRSMLIKHLTIGDVESLCLTLLPAKHHQFWSMDFYNTYKFILEKIPANKLYSYLKQIYTSKYHGKPFEMNIEFYKLQYYNMLSIDERETWALRHIERDLELPGIQNYIWYKFVSFPKAVSGIKRYIFLTPDKYERSRIINILPETARNQDDINSIISYYYERHVNESEEFKNSFIDKIIELHDIYSFNNECWTSLDKLLHSLEGYSTVSYTNVVYKFKSMIYHILQNNALPEALQEYVNCITHYHYIVEELSAERKVIVSRYLLSYLAEKIKYVMHQPGYEDVQDEDDYWGKGSMKDQVRDLISNIWNVIFWFNRPQEDCPEIAIKFMNSDMSTYQNHELFKTKFIKRSEGDFVRWLKRDIQLAITGISEIRCNAYRWNFRLCRLFRKLKVYFPNDAGKEYLKYFMEYLSEVPSGRREYRNIKMAVVGVFYLANPDTIISFLEENLPSSPKIDHLNIDNRVFQVQKAICRLSYHPRPPLPLPKIQKYITGDYVRFCLPMVYNYFANLPSNEKFIETLLDAPLSIQKHGLRLAFKGYVAEILMPIINSAWRKTKNVSLRMLLYETLFDRMLNEEVEVQKELYRVLKHYTSELNHDDHENIYSILVSDDFPDEFKGDFIETGWLTVSKLSDKRVDMQRRISVIRHMEKYMHLVQRDFLRQQIIDDHVDDMLSKKNMNNDSEDYYIEELIEAKWDLVAKYIINFNDEVEKQKSLELMQTIMMECRKSWNLISRKTYTVRKFMKHFIKTITDKDPKTIASCANVVHIYQCIRDNLLSFLKNEEMYLLNWELKLSILGRNIIHTSAGEENDPRYMSNEEIAYSYGKKVETILKRSVKDGIFYPCFYEAIANIVRNIASIICDILGKGGVYYRFLYQVCEILINTKTTETQVLALCMLPRDPESYWEREHTKVVTKLQAEFASQEVRGLFYEKYVLSDYEVRHFVI